MQRITCFSFLALLLISLGASAQKTWTGAVSTAWNTAGNWSPSGVPSASDNVIIASTTNQPVILATTGVCNSIVINSGASLGITASTLGNASLTASGSVTVNGSISMVGALTKTCKLIASGISWSAGSAMSGGITTGMEISGNWEFASGSAVSMGLTSVTFTGSSNSFIYSNSASSHFYSVALNKAAGYAVSIQAASTATLNIDGGITINAGNEFYGSVNLTTVLKGNLVNSGDFYFSAGTVSLEKSSGTQTIQVSAGSYFNNLTVNTGGTATLNNSTLVKGNLSILAGVLDPLNNTVSVQGNWTNSAGASAFTEGAGRVIFNGGNYHQYCSSETFNILEVNKSAGGALRMNGTAVSCAQYDWTAGSIDVLGSGTFTALDLADQGIRGNYYINTGCTINLYQDAAQYVDLGGNLTFTGGGTINVYGGNGTVSQWPTYANASITMSGGTLDFKDQSITINTLSGYSLTTNISGGTIRTPGAFFCSRSDFNPAGGTIELYGDTDSDCLLTAGSVRNLTINKNTDNTVTLGSGITINGDLTVTSGKLFASGKTLTLGGMLDIFSGGTLHLAIGAQLKMADTKELDVWSGATLITEGAGSDNVNITRNGTTGFYYLDVKPGGTISSSYTYFQYMHRVALEPGSVLDPLNSFYRCTFTNAGGGSPAMLVLSNDQDIDVYGASFPTLNSTYNVSKPNNAGHVTFTDAQGAYAGASWESDPYGRIDWVASTPGLWTGIVSSDWFTTGNWDDYTVPTAATNVTIPGGTPYAPVIGAGITYCNDLTVTSGGQLSLASSCYLYMSGNYDTEDGQVLMHTTAGIFLSGSSNTTLRPGLNDALANVNVYKSSSAYSVQLLSDLTCSGTFEVKEGTLTLDQPLTLRTTSTATSAFEVEIGGKLALSSGIIDSYGNVHFENGSQAQITGGSIYCRKDFVVDANSSYDIAFSGGSLTMGGTGTQYIDDQDGGTLDLYNLSFNNPGGKCYIKSADLDIANDLTISWGSFSCDNGPTPTATYNIRIAGDWYNNEGTDGFDPSTGVVTFNGSAGHQYCMNESFNTLVVDKASGALRVIESQVSCAVYDWTAGAVDVLNGGTFTAWDLADNGIYGNYYLNPGCVINLYQDELQWVDLDGNITFTGGGTMNVYGGNTFNGSLWPGVTSCSLTMDGGVLDFKDNPIRIKPAGGATVTANITGGTIRTTGNFHCDAADFDPTGGAIELYGFENTSLELVQGSLWDVHVNKDAVYSLSIDADMPISGNLTINGGTVSLAQPLAVGGDITVNGGTFAFDQDLSAGGNITINGAEMAATGPSITPGGNVNINTGGTLHLAIGAQLKMASQKDVNVWGGGLLLTEGAGTDNVNITRSGTTGGYYLTVKNGGTISSKYTYFQHMNVINLENGSFVDPVNPFYRCTFTNNSGAVTAMMVIANEQEITVNDAIFPALNSSYTVSKINDAGHVTFKDATGAFAGPAWENDPFGRVDWTYSVPGLWTGIVSSDWHDADNWDSGAVPDATTNVSIPAGTPNAPVIAGADAYCNDLLIGAGAVLTQNDGNLYVYRDFSSPDGQFLAAEGSFLWFAGSSNALWSMGADDTYAKVRINKNNVGTVVEKTGTDEMTLGSVRIMEGTLSITGDAWFSGSGTEALAIEDGGKLLSPWGWIWASGAVKVESGGILDIQGDLWCFSSFSALLGSQIPSYFLLTIHADGATLKIESEEEVPIAVHIDMFDPDYPCYLYSDLRVKHLDILYGTLDCQSNDIYISGSFSNGAGATGFAAWGGRVVFNPNPNPSSEYVSVSGTTNFNILEVNTGTDYLAVNGNITCNALEWTSGAVRVKAGKTFTIGDLLDNAILGSYTCEEGATLDISNVVGSTFVDLAGELHNYGGTIIITGSVAYWPYGGDAVLEMTGGVIDLKTSGLNIHDNSYSLAVDITGGTIRTPFNFSGNRAGFAPEGGTLEMYGPGDASLSFTNGCKLNSLLINKTTAKGEKDIITPLVDGHSGEVLNEGILSESVSLGSELFLAGDLVIQSGLFDPQDHTISIAGDWKNLAGPEAFLEGTGRVIFAGHTEQTCSSENFYTLEVDKYGQLIHFEPNAIITCQVYDVITWHIGGVVVSDGASFYVGDLAHDGLRGKWLLYENSTIEVHQDEAQSVGLVGAEVEIHGGTFDVYGGLPYDSPWGMESLSLFLTMTGGTLDFHDVEVNLPEDMFVISDFQLDGGVIRSAYGFDIAYPFFHPFGGTFEVYGSKPQTQVKVTSGATLHDLVINTGPGSITQMVGAVELYDLTILAGAVWLWNTNGYTLTVRDDLLITGQNSHLYTYAGGLTLKDYASLTLENEGTYYSGGTLILGDGALVNVNAGGHMILLGTPADPGLVTSVESSVGYGFYVNAGGELSAFYTSFEQMNGDGITLNPGSMIPPQLNGRNAFANCGFSGGLPGAYPLLTVNNEQDLVISFASFPENTWGGQYNVAKTNGAGSVILRGSQGEFAGEAFENDPGGLISWVDGSNQLDVKVWLEGPFNGTDMNVGLSGLPDFPLAQPFNTAPWNYEGTEALASLPAGIVDWVLVELRTASVVTEATSSRRLTRMAALLREDGSVVDLDGTSVVGFNFVPYNSGLYPVIYHRNHVGVISTYMCSFSDYVFSYDFRDNVLNAYGGADGYKLWAPGAAVMVAGDGDSDGVLTDSDRIETWIPSAALKGYFQGDFNLDGQVDNKDKNDLWWPNLQGGYESQVPY